MEHQARRDKVEHPGREERAARGVGARARALPASHAGWSPAPDRPDPVALIEEQNARRDQDLVPVRHGRMMASPFTFYRGAAKIMAVDLASTPTSGLEVQLCGDAHLSNFGVYGSPERSLVFDINDFDETLPGPFEYDVKRLAASLTVAASNNGFTPAQAFEITKACVTSYRESMAEFAAMRTLDIWYAHLSEDELRQGVMQATAAVKDKEKAKKKAKGKGKGKEKGEEKGELTAKEAKKIEKRFEKNAAKARSRDSLQALAKLTEVVGGTHRIVSVPPVIVPARDLEATYGIAPELMEEIIFKQFREYRDTLPLDRRHLLEHFEVVDWARKVVGVGSVGTRAFIALLQGADETDPLFLQIKEATSSVLEGPGRKSRFRQAGERVVQGQRLMQATSDIFLGWSKGYEDGRFFYWRQLRDMKGSAVVEQMPVAAMTYYGRTCGWTLARAHARSGDPVAIAAYLGTDDTFDSAITDFSRRYAEQNERDYLEFTAAIEASRIEAVQGV
ncbi:DUF2252 domain-containing protein [Nocardioides ungokensis]|uniref:DUF2252 domain-containing protein n=1 Tax=Nocardioides ungokensis TaxID=1643322 RepID=UPI0015DEA8E7|nr:DUF2252 domain-containing protein [Nocardioides ungokensis]